MARAARGAPRKPADEHSAGRSRSTGKLEEHRARDPCRQAAQKLAPPLDSNGYGALGGHGALATRVTSSMMVAMMPLMTAAKKPRGPL